VPTIDRLAVLAARAFAHGLDRRAATPATVPGIGLGVQDSPPGAARLAFAARVAGPGAAANWADDGELTIAWSVRGAPHVHRRSDLPGLAAALWPLDDADTAARLAWNAKQVAASGRPPLQALALTAQAVAEVAAEVSAANGAPLTKGRLSAEVTRRIPAELSRFCEPCGSVHVHEQLLRLATLPGGLMVSGSAPLEFSPVPGWPGVLAAVPGTGTSVEGLVRGYLHLYGPATPADVKTFLGCTTAAAKANWPADVVPVEVDLGDGSTRQAWALPADLAVLENPPEPPAARLLPPNDAFGKASDREVLVPDKAEQKAIWRVLGSPGVLLADAVPAGIWRPKASATRLDLTVETFAPLACEPRAAVAEEAERLAAVRGLTLGKLTLN
jgi:hypothetical protein